MVRIIGGGLAGSEAAWQVASRGLRVTLHEMRPVRPTAVHRSDRLAELVCSNSFRGDKLDNAVGLLKEEMRRLGSLLMRAAEARSAAVPAPSERDPVIVATGPLTSDILSADLARIVGAEHLYFYDAISPIVLAESIDRSQVFRQSRWDRSLRGKVRLKPDTTEDKATESSDGVRRPAD